MSKQRGRKQRQRQALVPAQSLTQVQIAEKETRLRLDNPQAWASAFGYSSASGKHVSLEAAMRLSAFWACVKVTAQAVSCLPGAMYEKGANDSREKVDDDLAEILTDSPNEDQTPLEFWEGNVAWLLTNGNAYSERVGSGRRLTALQPMAASHCWPVRLDDNELVYRFNDRGKTYDLPRDKVFHIKGFGFGGDFGLSAIRFGAQSFGSAIAINDAASRLFGSGMAAAGVLSSTSPIDKDQREDLQGIMEEFVSSVNPSKLLILEGGLQFSRMALSPLDAQLIENGKFSVEEVCRWVGTPPIIIGHAAQGQTMWGSGVEQILLAWLTLGIDPLCDRIEARVKKQLIRPTGRRDRYFEFNREALLQMDSKSKAAFLSTMTQNGLMTRNEGRAKLNLPWKQGGDELTAQTNLSPLDKLGAAATDGNQARAAMRAWLGDLAADMDKKEHTNEPA